jgi:hypothetical protein
LSAIGFAVFGASACAAAGAAILLAAGGDAAPSGAGGAADAAASSLYSHAEPIAGTKPKMANAVVANTRLMVAAVTSN